MTHNELPEGWCWAQLEDTVLNPKQGIVDGPFGSDLKSQEYRSSGVPIIRIQNVERRKFINENIRFISHEKAKELKRHDYFPGDIVITKLGAPLGRTCIVPNFIEPGIIVADVVRVRPPDDYISKEYLVHAINSDGPIQQLSESTKGTTRPRVNLGHIRSLSIPLPPLAEQKRIVAKVEELLARVSAAQERLAKVQMLLIRFRQSVLAAACLGRLTKDWRKKHPDIEPAPTLLRRIGFAQNNGKKKSHIKPHNLNLRELPELPKNWTWDFLGRTSQIIMGQSPPGNSYNSNGIGMPLINGPVEFGPKPFSSILKTKFTSKPTKLCKPNDLIICVRGSTTGRTNIAGFEACLGRGVAAIRTKMNQYYINYFIHSMREQIIRMGTGSTFPNIQLEVIETIRVPIPPIIEQHEIVSRVETLFNLADSIEKRVQLATAHAEKLTQSILAKAFRGELVLTEAEVARKEGRDYEPASELLKKIKREREKTESKPKKTVRRKRNGY